MLPMTWAYEAIALGFACKGTEKGKREANSQEKH
jgi:hypothetical protein